MDGHGTGIMTESSWIKSNRNPDWSKAEVEQALKERLGLRKIIWLPGIKGKDITETHVDFYARFVKPGVVIANLDNADAKALELLSGLYPDREMVMLNIDAIAAGGGGIHCVTCHQPAV